MLRVTFAEFPPNLGSFSSSVTHAPFSNASMAVTIYSIQVIEAVSGERKEAGRERERERKFLSFTHEYVLCYVMGNMNSKYSVLKYSKFLLTQSISIMQLPLLTS